MEDHRRHWYQPRRHRSDFCQQISKTQRRTTTYKLVATNNSHHAQRLNAIVLWVERRVAIRRAFVSEDYIWDIIGIHILDIVARIAGVLLDFILETSHALGVVGRTTASVCVVGLIAIAWKESYGQHGLRYAEGLGN